MSVILSSATGGSASLKRKHIEITTDDGEVETLEVTPLGAGNEVGRSCLLMKFKGKQVLLDVGIHPAYAGPSALPFFDEIEDPSAIDILLVSHFHLDHIAALPYFLAKTTFKGRVFMTHPTKSIYKLLLTDYLRVSNMGVDPLFTEQDLNDSMDKIEGVNFHQERDHNGIKFWCYNAGHVLGAAMFMIEIAGVKVLYTGDFSRQEDRHLMAAEIPQMCPDVLIVESTYGVQLHEPRKEREARFIGAVENIITRGGRCLIPVFALGRAQELLLILDEYWKKKSELKDVPILYASTLGKRCMSIYQTYTNMMNERIRRQASIGNPFVFDHIKDLTSFDDFSDDGPCVVMASPGMLQSGLSRQLFDLWAQGHKNGVVIPGYCVEGTLAKTILNEPSEVENMEGRKVPLKLSVHYISFSAHSDFAGTSSFIDALAPPNVILVHGEKNEMGRLQQALRSRYEDKRKIEILAPRNAQTVRLAFRGHKVAKAVGSVARGGAQHLSKLSGLLVQQDFQYTIVQPEDLHTYTKLTTTVITQSQTVPFSGSWRSLCFQLSQMYEDVVQEKSSGGDLMARIHSTVTLSLQSAKSLFLEWESSPMNDMVADSVVSVILQMSSNPLQFSAVDEEKSQSDVEEDRLQQILKIFTARFGDDAATVDRNTTTITLTVDQMTASYNYISKALECEDATLTETLEMLLQHIHQIVYPIPPAARAYVTEVDEAEEAENDPGAEGEGATEEAEANEGVTEASVKVDGGDDAMDIS